MHLSSLPAFMAVVVVISASPGPAIALILRRSALLRLRSAVATGLGLGLYIWALLAAAGFAALVSASELTYPGPRIVSAVVLVALGVRAWRTVLRERRARDDATAPPAASEMPRRWGWCAASREGGGGAAGQSQGRRLHDRVLPAVRAPGPSAVRHHRCARPGPGGRSTWLSRPGGPPWMPRSSVVRHAAILKGWFDRVFVKGFAYGVTDPEHPRRTLRYGGANSPASGP